MRNFKVAEIWNKSYKKYQDRGKFVVWSIRASKSKFFFESDYFFLQTLKKDITITGTWQSN